ncbi:hypothetical protein ACIQMR_34875 [Streptomyces sp. NPDC091376]|uniref:hypothetical protein n=1 Tax=Streptomyces sp. NPDC091376 TaxID=3365994 RepID=UPI003825DC9C
MPRVVGDGKEPVTAPPFPVAFAASLAGAVALPGVSGWQYPALTASFIPSPPEGKVYPL